MASTPSFYDWMKEAIPANPEANQADLANYYRQTYSPDITEADYGLWESDALKMNPGVAPDALRQHFTSTYGDITPDASVWSDVGTGLKVGLEKLPGTLTGLADLPIALATGYQPFDAATDWIGEKTGFQPGKWAEQARQQDYSPAMHRAEGNVTAAWDQADQAWQQNGLASLPESALNVAGALASNPRYLAKGLAESIPGMVAGGVAGRLALGVGAVAGTEAAAAVPGYLGRALGQYAPVWAGAGGEGAVQAGSAMDEYHGDDPRAGALAALGSGVADTLIAGKLGKLAFDKGVLDVQTALAGGRVAGTAAGNALGTGLRVGLGAANEMGQEFLQSGQEQAWANWANDRPLMENVPRMAVEGSIQGALLGGPFNLLSGQPMQPRVDPAPAAEAPPAGLLVRPGQIPIRMGAGDTLVGDNVDPTAPGAAPQGAAQPADPAAQGADPLRAELATQLSEHAWYVEEIAKLQAALAKGNKEGLAAAAAGNGIKLAEHRANLAAQLDDMKRLQAGREARIGELAQLFPEMVANTPFAPKPAAPAKGQPAGAPVAEDPFFAQPFDQTETDRLNKGQNRKTIGDFVASLRAAPDADLLTRRAAFAGRTGKKAGALDSLKVRAIDFVLTERGVPIPQPAAAPAPAAPATAVPAPIAPSSTMDPEVRSLMGLVPEGVTPHMAQKAIEGLLKLNEEKLSNVVSNATTKKRPDWERAIAQHLLDKLRGTTTTTTVAPAAAPAPVQNTPAADPATADVGGMTQDQYLQHLEANGLPQGVSAYDALTARPELRGLTAQQRADHFTNNAARARAFTQRMTDLWEGIRRAPVNGIKAIGASSGWTNFEVGSDTHTGTVRHKSYATLRDAVDLSKADARAFLSALQAAGFNGQVKFPGIGARALVGFDNIVMHGATSQDAVLGRDVASAFFGSRVTGTQVGKDTNGKSHTEQLADALEAKLRGTTATAVVAPAAAPVQAQNTPAAAPAPVAPAAQAAPTPEVIPNGQKADAVPDAAQARQEVPAPAQEQARQEVLTAAPVAQATGVRLDLSTGQSSDRFDAEVAAPARAAVAQGNSTSVRLRNGTTAQLVLGVDPERSPGQMRVLALNERGQVIGESDFASDGSHPAVWVAEEHRRNGLASAMYGLAETNGAVIPTLEDASALRTEDGQAFRQGLAAKRAPATQPAPEPAPAGTLVRRGKRKLTVDMSTLKPGQGAVDTRDELAVPTMLPGTTPERAAINAPTAEEDTSDVTLTDAERATALAVGEEADPNADSSYEDTIPALDRVWVTTNGFMDTLREAINHGEVKRFRSLERDISVLRHLLGLDGDPTHIYTDLELAKLTGSTTSEAGRKARARAETIANKVLARAVLMENSTLTLSLQDALAKYNNPAIAIPVHGDRDIADNELRVRETGASGELGVEIGFDSSLDRLTRRVGVQYLALVKQYRAAGFSQKAAEAKANSEMAGPLAKLRTITERAALNSDEKLSRTSETTPERDPFNPEDEASYLRQRTPEQGAKVEQVRSWLSKPLAALASWVNINIVASVEELRQRTGVDAPSDVTGMRYRGQVWVVAETNGSRAKAMQTLAHEVVGHLGLEKLLEPKLFNALLHRVQTLVKSEASWLKPILAELRKSYTDENGGYALNAREEAKEILAKLAEKHPHYGIVREMIAAVRLWLAKHGFGDLDRARIESLLVTAARATRTELGSQETLLSATSQAFSRDGTIKTFQRDMEDQTRWLSDKARAAGFESLDAMAADPEGMMQIIQAAAQWRDEHPMEANFSRVPPAVAQATINAMPSELRENAQTLWSLIKNSVKKGVLALTFTHDLVARMEKAIPAAARLVDAVRKGEALGRQFEKGVSGILDDFAKLPKVMQNQVNQFLYNSTMQQRWGYQPSWRKDVEINDEAKAGYAALSPEAQALVNRVFEHGHKTLVEKQRLLENQAAAVYDNAIQRAKDQAAQATDQAEKQKLLAAVSNLEKQRTAAIKAVPKLTEMAGPYAPLKRFGNYVVVGTSQAYRDALTKAQATGDYKEVRKLQSDGRHYEVQFAESYFESKKIQRALAATGLLVNEPHEKQAWRDGRPIGFEAFERLRALIKQSDPADTGHPRSASNARLVHMVEQLALQALSEHHARQATNARRRVAGADQDMMRAFATQGRADAHWIANLNHLREINDALAQAERAANQEDKEFSRAERTRLMNELYTRYAARLEYRGPSWQDQATAFSSLWHLTMSPAFYLQNALQPALMTQPWLAKDHGYKRSWGAMLTAYREVGQVLGKAKFFEHMDLTQLPADVKAVVQDLVDKGLIDITLETELGRFTSGATTTAFGKAANLYDTTVRRLPGKLEMVNRLTTAMAAYRLSKQRGETEEQARKYAMDAVQTTQGDYTGFNAPRPWHTVPGAKVLLQFRKFQLIQLAYLTKLVHQSFTGDDRAAAGKALAWALGHNTLLAGAMGLPAMGLVSLFAGSLTGDEEPDDIEVKARRGLKAMGFDPTVIDVLMNGVAAPAVGSSLTSKIGMGQVLSPLPYAQGDLTSRTGYQGLATAALGPTLGGLGQKFAEGLGFMERGDYYKGMERLMPKGASDLIRAGRLATEGETTQNRDQVLKPEELSVWDTLATALGLPSATLTDRWAGQRMVTAYEEHFTQRTSAIKRDYVSAYKSGDSAGMAQARDAWQALQDAKRRNGIKTTPWSELMKAPAETRKRERQTTGGLKYDKGTRRFVEAVDELW